jgi:hypothetical protein
MKQVDSAMYAETSTPFANPMITTVLINSNHEMKSINIELSILDNNMFVFPFLPIFLNQTIINTYAINITASIDIETNESISTLLPDHIDSIGNVFVIPKIAKDNAGIKIIKKEMFLKKSIF